MDDLFSRIRRTFPRRPLVVELVAAGVLFLWILWAASDAVVPFGHLLLLAVLALGLVGLWGLHWLASLVARSRGQMGAPLTGKEWVAWVVLPLLLFSGYTAAKLRIPLRLRFEMSRAAFEEYVTSAREGEGAEPEGLGLYRVRGVEFHDGVPHVSTAFELFDYGGFVLLPDGPPPDARPYTYRHLTGRWYTFVFRD